METERAPLSHSVSLSEPHTTHRRDQNQNEESPSYAKDSPLRLGTRLTKSASWFNSLSRRASRKTPMKKRSFAAFSSTGNESFTTPRPRLNKSDWDVRVVGEEGGGGLCSTPLPPALAHTRSTDCLDLDTSTTTCPGSLDLVAFSPTGSTTKLDPTLGSTSLGSPTIGSTSLDLVTFSPTGVPSVLATPDLLLSPAIAKAVGSPETESFSTQSFSTTNTPCTSCLYHGGSNGGLSSEKKLPADLSDKLSPGGSARYRVRVREKMRKYHAVIRLNTSSNSDISSLDLSHMEEGEVLPENPALYYTIDSRRLASKHKKSLRERKLLNGVKQFNLDPEKGLKYLQEFQFIDSTPTSVAKFLFRQERLSKKQIGKYLGSHHDFNKQVLQEFVKCHDFPQLLLVQALRTFLWSFRLPGEAMQIDRVMDAFAQRYCHQNPYIFQEPDTCFILSFSIIMLNTALHNPNAKMKITVEQFIKQNKGINSGRDLPADMLEAIFRNIKEEPFKIPDETYDDLMYTFFSPEREGWLLKQGGSWKSWKRRWFVLNDRCLYYFQHTAENVPKGIIPLENVRVRALDEKDGKQYVFEIYSEQSEIIKGCKTDSHGTVVQGNHKYYRMSAATKEDRDDWIECIQDSIRDNPFHKIIADKKAAIRRRSGGNELPFPNPRDPLDASSLSSKDED